MFPMLNMHNHQIMHQRKLHLDYISIFHVEARYISELLTDQILPKGLIIKRGVYIYYVPKCLDGLGTAMRLR